MKITISQLRGLIKSALMESFAQGLTPEDEEELSYLVHDKNHVMTPKGIPALDKAINSMSEECSVPLYRGLHSMSLDDFSNASPGKVVTFRGYTSFSEDPLIAQSFAKTSKTVLVLSPTSKGFNYSGWLRSKMEDLREEDPDTFDESDGETLIETCDEEKEWIFPQGSSFRVISTSSKNGFTECVVEIA